MLSMLNLEFFFFFFLISLLPNYLSKNLLDQKGNAFCVKMNVACT